MYLNAESVSVDSDEGSLTLEIFGYANTPDADEVTLTVNIHGIDLDAFYDSVRAGIEPWLRERDEALRSRPTAVVTTPGPYALTDPKHPDYRSVHADIWDSRAGK